MRFLYLVLIIGLVCGSLAEKKANKGDKNTACLKGCRAGACAKPDGDVDRNTCATALEACILCRRACKAEVLEQEDNDEDTESAEKDEARLEKQAARRNMTVTALKEEMAARKKENQANHILCQVAEKCDGCPMHEAREDCAAKTVNSTDCGATSAHCIQDIFLVDVRCAILIPLSKIRVERATTKCENKQRLVEVRAEKEKKRAARLAERAQRQVAREAKQANRAAKQAEREKKRAEREERRAKKEATTKA